MPRSLSLSPLSLSLPPSLPLSLSFFSAPVHACTCEQAASTSPSRVGQAGCQLSVLQRSEGTAGISRPISAHLIDSLHVPLSAVSAVPRPYLVQISTVPRPHTRRQAAKSGSSPHDYGVCCNTAAARRVKAPAHVAASTSAAPRRHITAPSRLHVGYTSAARRHAGEGALTDESTNAGGDSPGTASSEC